MNQRVKDLRKAIGITQEAFASRIGLTGAALSRIESGQNALTEPNIRSIVREYGVDEIWLRTGSGEMFRPRSRDEEITAFVGDILSGPPDFRQRFISALTKLSTDEWRLLEKLTDKLVEEQKKEADRE